MEHSRTLSRNMQIEGTPRHEKGWRAFVKTVGPDMNKYWEPQIRYHKSPLMPNEAEAQAWQPRELV